MLCDRAYQMGLYSITVTDHCDCNDYYPNNVRQDIEGSIRDTLKARGLYAEKIRIYLGIELGQPTQDTKAAEEALSLGAYDFVLGSLHNLRGEQDFYFLKYNEENAPKLLNRYFEEMMEHGISPETVKWLKCRRTLVEEGEDAELAYHLLQIVWFRKNRPDIFFS